MLLNQRHGVHQLVQDELHRTKTVMHPNIEMKDIRAAIAVSGVGLDHFSGEQVMVLGLGGGEHRFHVFGLVTDRRVFGASGSERFEARFSEIVGVRVADTIFDRKIYLQTQQGEVQVPVGPFQQPLAAFLNRLITAPPAHREPAPTPLATPTESDPTGARSAQRSLGIADARTTMLLSAIEGGHQRGEIPLEVAQDFVLRVMLLHRNIHYGRGMVGGRWISALGADDLSNALVQLFGNPLSHTEHPVRTLELPSNLKSGVGKAAVSSAIGLASAAILGVGWVSTARSRIPWFRFMVADTGSFSSFRVQAPNGRGLHQCEPGLLMQLDGKLLGLEDEILARRIAFGWNEKTPALLGVDPNAVAARLTSLAAAAAPARSVPAPPHPTAAPLH